MKYVIFCLVILFSTLMASAQKADTKKPKIDAPTIDYHTPGVVMPPLKLVSLDTLSKKYQGKKLEKVNRKNKERFGYAPITRIYTSEDLDDGQPMITMIFNPTCGHCEDMTDLLEKHIGELKNVKLVMVANPATKDYVPDFIRIHKVKDFFPQIIIGYDSSKYIDNLYLYTSIPQLSIYSKDRKLIKIFNGDILVDSVKKYLE